MRTRLQTHAARLLIVGGWLLLPVGCATAPRVVEVTRTETLLKEGQQSRRHPRAASEDVYVAWASSAIDSIKLEYRQVNAPGKISEQIAPATRRQWTTFNISTNDVTRNGPISAWRVTLWRGDEQLAEKKSVLW